MAKTKKIARLSDEELIAPLPTITADLGAALAVPKYDFVAQKQFLEMRIDQVLSEELTEKNIERIKTLKKGVVSWRTTFTKESNAYMDATFKAPMGLFKAASNEVLAEIDRMESKLDEVLDKEEEKRRDNINTLLDGLMDELQDEYKLPDDYYERVERRKAYYNKTAVMSDVANDLRAQFSDLAKEYKNYTLAVKTINSLCKDDKRLNTDMYIQHLKYSELAEVMEEIETEKNRLKELDAPKPVETEPEEKEIGLEADEDGKIRIGVKADSTALKSDFPGVTKTMTLQITYPVDCGDELTLIFGELKKNGIKMKVVSCVENTPEIPVF